MTTQELAEQLLSSEGYKGHRVYFDEVDKLYTPQFRPQGRKGWIGYMETGRYRSEAVNLGRRSYERNSVEMKKKNGVNGFCSVSTP